MSINNYTHIYIVRQIFYIPLRYEFKEINNRNKEIKLATPTKSGSNGQSINLWTMAAACCCKYSRCRHQLLLIKSIKFGNCEVQPNVRTGIYSLACTFLFYLLIEIIHGDGGIHSTFLHNF